MVPGTNPYCVVVSDAVIFHRQRPFSSRVENARPEMMGSLLVGWRNGQSIIIEPEEPAGGPIGC